MLAYVMLRSQSELLTATSRTLLKMCDRYVPLQQGLMPSEAYGNILRNCDILDQVDHQTSSTSTVHHLLMATSILKTLFLLYSGNAMMHKQEWNAFSDAQRACEMLFGSLIIHSVIVLFFSLPILVMLDGWKAIGLGLTVLFLVFWLIVEHVRYTSRATAVLDV